MAEGVWKGARNTGAVEGRERVTRLDGKREGHLEAWNPGSWAFGQWINSRLQAELLSSSGLSSV